MSIKEEILVIDVNVIIHLEKANLLNELIKDKSIRIVNLVLYQEYEYKKNLASDKIKTIKTIGLSSKEMAEAHLLYEMNSRNTIFDYYSFIAARNNNYALLTGDWKLKKVVGSSINVYGAIWYVQKLRKEGKIDDARLRSVYETWLDDPSVYIRKDLLFNLIVELDSIHE